MITNSFNGNDKYDVSNKNNNIVVALNSSLCKSYIKENKSLYNFFYYIFKDKDTIQTLLGEDLVKEISKKLYYVSFVSERGYVSTYNHIKNKMDSDYKVRIYIFAEETVINELCTFTLFLQYKFKFGTDADGIFSFFKKIDEQSKKQIETNVFYTTIIYLYRSTI